MKVSSGVVSVRHHAGWLCTDLYDFLSIRISAGLSFKQYDGFLKGDPDACQHRNTDSSPGNDQ